MKASNPACNVYHNLLTTHQTPPLHPANRLPVRLPVTRYVKLWVAHKPGMPGAFSPPLTSKESDIKRSRDASRHMRHVFLAFPAYAQAAILRT